MEHTAKAVLALVLVAAAAREAAAVAVTARATEVAAWVATVKAWAAARLAVVLEEATQLAS